MVLFILLCTLPSPSKSILLTKITAALNEVALIYHRVRRLYFLAVVFVTTIDQHDNSVTVVLFDPSEKDTICTRERGSCAAYHNLPYIPDRYKVTTMEDAVKEGQLYVTATGNINVIKPQHMIKMKDMSLLCNIGMLCMILR